MFDPDLFYAGNLDRDGEIIPYGSEGYKLAQGAERFHTDSSFHAMPTKWSLLLGHETPPPEAGGDTCFVDARAAWDDLPAETKARIENLVGVHDFWEGRRRAGLKGEITPEMRRIIPFPPVEHPLVRTVERPQGALRRRPLRRSRRDGAGGRRRAGRGALRPRDAGQVRLPPQLARGTTS